MPIVHFDTLLKIFNVLGSGHTTIVFVIKKILLRIIIRTVCEIDLKFYLLKLILTL